MATRLPYNLRPPFKMAPSQLVAALLDEATSLVDAVLHFETATQIVGHNTILPQQIWKP